MTWPVFSIGPSEVRHAVNPARVRHVAEHFDLAKCWIEYENEAASILANHPFEYVVAALSEPNR
jgi:hypothetical protein